MMEFYNDPLKVDEYEKMCNEYDGLELYNVLSNHLKKDSSLLEIGCGPGNDITYLQRNYSVTGSDLSDELNLKV
jgi:cyclopropane fatty-acyl-phospholipid synthase-like methyltransferase